jgi:ABC-type uncharacterized transport system substrate-binding protein
MTARIRSYEKAVSRMARNAVLFALAVGMAVGATPASAAVTQSDVLVAGRAIGFMQKFGAGDLRLGIVYAPDSAQSLQQANELQAILGNQFRAGNIVLRPFLVRLDQIGTANASLFFLTEGMGAAATRIAGASKDRKIPCITFDLAQVRSGACAVGVQSSPRIDVFVNAKAAADSGAVFSSVFRLMITEY